MNFEKYFEHPAIRFLTTNYRSNKTIVGAGNALILNNPEGSQIKKILQANTVDQKNNSENKITVFLSRHEKNYFTNYKKQIAEKCVNQIKECHNEGISFDDMMVLYRITDSKIIILLEEAAKKNGIPLNFAPKGHESKFLPENKNGVLVATVHKCKGLEAKAVFILNVDKGLYGFPCELENPVIYETAKPINEVKDKLEEERRLFYVAITRAKEKLFIFAQKGYESKFLDEIKNFTEKKELYY